MLFDVASTFNSDVTVQNDIVVVGEIRKSSGEVYATEDFVQTAVNQLIGAAPEALNTLQELAAALGNDENFATTILNAVAASTNSLRYDINNQNLTTEQKANAVTNLGLATVAVTGSYNDLSDKPVTTMTDVDMYAAAMIM